MGLWNDMHLWLKCDDDAANTTVTDSGPNGTDGTSALNTSTMNLTSAPSGNGFRLDGGADYITFGNIVDQEDNYTILLFFQTADASGNICTKKDSNEESPPDFSWAFEWDVWAIFNDGTNRTATTTVATTGWHHLAVSVNGANSKVLVNGKEEKTFSETAAEYGQDFRIGCFFDDPPGPPPGAAAAGISNFDMDNFMVFDRALTTTEVDCVRNNGFGSDIINEFDEPYHRTGRVGSAHSQQRRQRYGN